MAKVFKLKVGTGDWADVLLGVFFEVNSLEVHGVDLLGLVTWDRPFFVRDFIAIFVEIYRFSVTFSVKKWLSFISKVLHFCSGVVMWRKFFLDGLSDDPPIPGNI